MGKRIFHSTEISSLLLSCSCFFHNSYRFSFIRIFNSKFPALFSHNLIPIVLVKPLNLIFCSVRLEHCLISQKEFVIGLTTWTVMWNQQPLPPLLNQDLLLLQVNVKTVNFFRNYKFNFYPTANKLKGLSTYHNFLENLPHH